MGKTTKNYKGKTYKAKDRKKTKEKKYFGETSGSHSQGLYDREIVDGKTVYKKSDRAPKKGEDFIKYGWPLELRKGKVLKNLQKKRDADKKIKDLKKGANEN